MFSVENKYAVKYANLPILNYETRKQCRKEFDFYTACANKKLDFLPEIVFSTADDTEILIVMKLYNPIKPNEWDENLQKTAAELCAKINAVDATDFNNIFQIQEEEPPYPLSLSYQNWINLQEKFPQNINAALLKEMHENFADISSLGESAIPKTLCHGDYHPQNFVRNAGKLIICDWQNVGMGKGIGDITFFISRGADMGLKIDRDKLIADYCGALLRYANINVSMNDLYKTVAVNEFTVSFKFWAQYLQESDIDRVIHIYDAMVESYRFIVG